MITLIPLGRIITMIAVIYAVMSCVLLWVLYDPTTSLWKAIGIATGGSALLNIAIFMVFQHYWQCLWRKYPALNTLLFPNLNGTWDMIIHWESGDKNGTSSARAKISQTFLSIAMDVEARDSDSYTLMAKPKKDPESGRPLLYYIYQTTPKHISENNNYDTYRGAAILQLGLENTNRLSGNYFTSRQTNGHLELNRVNI